MFILFDSVDSFTQGRRITMVQSSKIAEKAFVSQDVDSDHIFVVFNLCFSYYHVDFTLNLSLAPLIFPE